MDTKVERLEDNKVKVTVTVPAESIDELFKQAYKETNKKNRIPGFRPGKAPRPALDAAFGKDYFAAMVTDTILKGQVPVAIDDQDIIFLKEPDFGEEVPAVEGEDYTVEVTGTVKPVIELSSYDPVSIELPSVDATDEEVNGQIDMLLNYYVSYEDLDRAAQDGDVLFVDLDCVLKDEQLAGMSGENRQVELGADIMPEEFDAAFIGHKAGDEFEFDFGMKDDPLEIIEGDETIHVKAKINRVTEKKLPELTDEWVNENCSYESVQELKDRVGSSISSQKAASLTMLKEQNCCRALGERYDGEIPEEFEEETRNDLFRTLFYQMQEQGLSLEQYCINNQITPDQLREDIKAQAADHARENLALDALAKHLGIQATTDEVRNEFVRSGAEDPNALMEQWRQDGRLSAIREGIKRARAAEWLTNTANVTVLAPGEQPNQDKDDKKAAKKTAKKAEAKSAKKTSKKADAADAAAEGEVNLSKMTVAQLKEYAAEKGIDLAGATKKADIIAAIEG